MEFPKAAIWSGLDELRTARGSNRGLFFSVLFFSVFVNLLMLTGPIFMLQIYDRVLTSRSEETLVALSILVAALYLLMAVLDFARGRVMARIGARIQEALDDRIFGAVIKRAVLPKDEIPTHNSLRDLDSVQGFIASPGFMAILDVPWTPVFIVAIFIFHPLLGWLAVAGGAILIVLAVINQFVTRKKAREAQLATEGTHALADEMRRGYEIVRTQGMQADILDRWKMRRRHAHLRTTRR